MIACMAHTYTTADLTAWRQPMAAGQASTLPMALVLLLRLGGPLAAVQATSTTSHASSSSSSSCADALVDACPPGAVRCGVCVAEQWPELRDASCAKTVTLGQALAQHCSADIALLRLPPPPHHSTAMSVGLFKSTWAASDPRHTTMPALLRYLPVTETADSCPNNTCTCGSSGRTQIVGSHFGLHTVFAAGPHDCRATPPLTGSFSLSEVEGIFDEECGDMTAYSPWMDYNVRRSSTFTVNSRAASACHYCAEPVCLCCWRVS